MRVEGYDFDAQAATILSSDGRVFCVRCTRPSRWLRFLMKSDGSGWHVTGYKTKRAASHGFAPVRDPAGRFLAWLIATGAEPTASEALAAAGYTHRRPAGTEPGSIAASRHEVFDARGNVVARLTAREMFRWLRAQSRAASLCLLVGRVALGMRAVQP